MNTENHLKLADAAITHVLRRIHESSEVGYYMGHGTESFSRLVTAFAAIHGRPKEEVHDIFAPSCARDPRRDLEKRIDELEEKLEERAVTTGCGIEDIPTYGPQSLSADEFVERVKDLLWLYGDDSRKCVDAISALYELTEIPFSLIARKS